MVTVAALIHVTITCSRCGHRHQLERIEFFPGPVWIVCHRCELPLVSAVEAVAATADDAHRFHDASAVGSAAPSSDVAS